jgi:hypothetical protein
MKISHQNLETDSFYTHNLKKRWENCANSNAMMSIPNYMKVNCPKKQTGNIQHYDDAIYQLPLLKGGKVGLYIFFPPLNLHIHITYYYSQTGQQN